MIQPIIDCLQLTRKSFENIALLSNLNLYFNLALLPILSHFWTKSQKVKAEILSMNWDTLSKSRNAEQVSQNICWTLVVSQSLKSRSV